MPSGLQETLRLQEVREKPTPTGLRELSMRAGDTPHEVQGESDWSRVAGPPPALRGRWGWLSVLLGVFGVLLLGVWAGINLREGLSVGIRGTSKQAKRTGKRARVKRRMVALHREELRQKRVVQRVGAGSGLRARPRRSSSFVVLGADSTRALPTKRRQRVVGREVDRPGRRVALRPRAARPAVERRRPISARPAVERRALSARGSQQNPSRQCGRSGAWLRFVPPFDKETSVGLERGTYWMARGRLCVPLRAGRIGIERRGYVSCIFKLSSSRVSLFLRKERPGRVLREDYCLRQPR